MLPIDQAPKDGTYILAWVKDRPTERFSNHAGRPFAIRHLGFTEGSNIDLGWALYPGMGVGDDWFEGWVPLPAKGH